jgi:predicted dinucleotide-binding enzyme
MKITIIGTGNIGAALGQGWVREGHEVIYGTRDTAAAKVRALLESLTALGGRAEVMPVAEAISAGQAVVFAIPGGAMDETITANSAQLDGKIVIDAGNNVGQAELNSLAAFAGHTPAVKYFRAFSNLGWENFTEPVIHGEQVDLFYCGDPGDAQSQVEGLITDLGLRPIYVGGREAVGAVDGLTRLWFALVFQRGYSRHTAFKLLAG